MKKESLVARHVGDIYRNANSGKNQSWSILNGALTETLRTCITAHLPFEIADFGTIYDQFKGGYWFGTDGDVNGMGTSLYSIAVDAGNMSACLSFEKWRGFAPFLYMGRRLSVAGMPYGSDAGELWWLEKSPSKIITSATTASELDVVKAISRKPFAKRWWVTGIGDTLRLASYYRSGNTYGHRAGTPTKLMQLTHEQLDTMSRDIRKAIKDARPKKEAVINTSAV